MFTKRLCFYGVSVEIKCGPHAGFEATISKLAQDFSYFSHVNGTPPGGPQIEIELISSTLAKKPPPFAIKWFKTPMGYAFGWRGDRYCIYDPGHWAILRDFRGLDRVNLKIFGNDLDLIYEIAFVALLSTIGEKLDFMGFHRIHALALQVNNKTAVLVLPQGGGKSALAALCLERYPDSKIFADEITLIKNGIIYPFPMRGALRPQVFRSLGLALEGRIFNRSHFQSKLTYAIPETRVPGPAKPDYLLAGQINLGNPRISSANRLLGIGSLLHSMVIGIGVPQMREYLVRTATLLRLPKLALHRFKAAIQVTAEVPIFKFDVSADAFKNLEVLMTFLDKNPKIIPTPYETWMAGNNTTPKNSPAISEATATDNR